jgi:hypothetical protein
MYHSSLLLIFFFFFKVPESISKLKAVYVMHSLHGFLVACWGAVGDTLLIWHQLNVKIK